MCETNIAVADVGVEVFNNDHQRLLFYVMAFQRLVARFQDRPPCEDEWDQLDGIFPRLEKYTDTHFAAEEALMRERGYPLLEEHIAQHRGLLQQLQGLKARITARDHQGIASLESFLVDWLCNHINRTDVKYKGFFQLAESREVLDKALFNEMISADQLHKIVTAAPPGTMLVDVRTAIEQQEGVIPGSHLFPCDHNLANRQDTQPFIASFTQGFDPQRFDPEMRYILICRSGPRTEIALEHFLDNDLKACELIGGIEEWKRQGLPLAPVDADTPVIPRAQAAGAPHANRRGETGVPTP